MRIAFAVFAVCALAVAQDAGTVTVQGCVLDVLGAGVPAAEVTATGDGKVVGRTFADGDGVFQLARLPAGQKLRISAVAKGMVRAEASATRGAGVRVLVLTLEDGAELRGTVNDATGKAIANAAVIAYAIDAEVEDAARNWSAETTTDSKGAYHLTGVPLRGVLLRAWAPGSGLGSSVEHVTGNATRDFTLAAGPAEARTVHVEGLPPAACPTARVEIYARDRPETLALPAALRSVPLQPDGRAALWPLPFAHDVMLVVPGYNVVPVHARCKADSLVDLAFRVAAIDTPTSTSLRGKVVDPDDKPLANVRVLWAKSRVEPAVAAVTDTQGRFTMTVPLRTNAHAEVALDDPRWRLGTPGSTVFADACTWIECTTDPTAEHVLRATPACTLQGVVTDEVGNVLPFAAITLMVKDVRSVNAFVAATQADRTAKCKLTGLAAGDYVVTVTTLDGRVGTTERTLQPGEPVALGPVAFDPCGEIIGVVRDAQGKPQPGLPVGIRKSAPAAPRRAGRQTANEQRGTRTDKDGRFRVRGLSAGTWVAWLARGKEPLTVEVDGGKTVSIELKAGQ